MEKTKLLLAVFVVIILTGIFSVALAAQNKNQANANCENKCGDGICQEVVCEAVGCPCAETKSTCARDCKIASTDNEDNEDEDEDNDEIASGQANAELHRSVVANFVQSLLKVASRSEGGIGEQVRVIAREQNDNKETTADQIEAVQHRNKFKTFLIGTDYKNVGALRSEMVQTRNRLQQLNRLMEQTTVTADKAELQTQITTLEAEQTKIETLLKKAEGKFSLLGWLVKLFSKD